ncbi:MAG: hypothetical protein K2Y23_05460 [Cyanobacteria bacterium]|nr:hypothetical protein [Cyanobacteriota bacterium]
MKTVITRMLIAMALAIAAWLSWSESTLAARVAEARQDVATLNHQNLDAMTPQAALSDYFPGERRTLSDDVRIAKSTVAYWLGRYGAVAADTTDSNADATVLLTAANAAYREAQRDSAVGPAAVQRLDGVLQAYASAMKASPRNVEALASVAVAKEAAFNYEYVARIRDEVARSPQGRIARSPAANGPVMGGDLPAGATIHGGPGAPPPDAKMEELQTIMPMEYGDREAQPEATPGAKRERKG